MYVLRVSFSCPCLMMFQTIFKKTMSVLVGSCAPKIPSANSLGFQETRILKKKQIHAPSEFEDSPNETGGFFSNKKNVLKLPFFGT